MDLRIFIEPQQGATYADQLRIARAAEDLGYDAFFRSDHFQAMGGDDGLPGPTDSWITLAGIARETDRIRLGTMVSSATFRLPGVLAIEVAQVDEMSAGRVELGLGAGWFETEHTSYGIEFFDVRERFDRFAEQVELIDGLWTTPVGQTYSFTGKHYQVTDSPALPKPVQWPRPPLILGGAGKRRSATLAARFADEYNAGFDSVGDTAAIFGRVRDAAAETGRPLTLSVAHTVCVGRDEAELARRADAIGWSTGDVRDKGIGGTVSQVVERIGQYADVGATRVYLQVLDLTDLDHLELIASEVMPQV